VPHSSATFSAYSGKSVRIPRYARNSLICVAAFIGSLWLLHQPALLDYPLTRLLNSFANRSRLLDTAINDLDSYAVLTGALVMALVWSCWGMTTDEDHRARVLVGTLLAFPIGILSRFGQHVLHTHPRPMYDPALHFHLPSVAGTGLNTWNAFPSDHAAVMGALAFVIYIARPRLGLLLIPWLVLIELARTYMGAHYPSDLIGGAALAGAVIWAVQTPWIVAMGRQVVRLERPAPAAFYALAFLATFEIATLFDDVRSFVGSFHLVSLR
jgi:membrane-associated phospholipid phosphatase